jgi:hypothetical protein
VLRPSEAAAQTTFKVDTLSDAIDVSPGDRACATAGGQCTLHAAVIAANSLPGDDTITFRVAGPFALKLLVLAEVERLERPQAASQEEQSSRRGCNGRRADRSRRLARTDRKIGSGQVAAAGSTVTCSPRRSG